MAISNRPSDAFALRNDLLHGAGNERYLQRADYRLLIKGKVSKDKVSQSKRLLPSVQDAMTAPWVFNREAALALWS